MEKGTNGKFKQPVINEDNIDDRIFHFKHFINIEIYGSQFENILNINGRVIHIVFKTSSILEENENEEFYNHIKYNKEQEMSERTSETIKYVLKNIKIMKN
ncbi:hypothetical protein H8356DRAFT_1323516 [Neocallimastix lanati (nom. inval.)]|nr:hypothetical protein H8356DRAFT_1323516 [Neocallimastix sp. JGI-2020a]